MDMECAAKIYKLKQGRFILKKHKNEVCNYVINPHILPWKEVPWPMACH
jgi:hypothetical protein